MNVKLAKIEDFLYEHPFAVGIAIGLADIGFGYVIGRNMYKTTMSDRLIKSALTGVPLKAALKKDYGTLLIPVKYIPKNSK